MHKFSGSIKQFFRQWKTEPVHPEPPQSAPFWLRGSVQLGFVIFSILLGLQFRTFLQTLQNEAATQNVLRPAAVEGYLPISSLMSLVHFLKTGDANTVHPAGLVIFSLILLLALAMRRGFCSWVCPFGTVSEWLYRIGAFIFGKNIRVPRILDILLRSIKYLLFGFFFYFIVTMPTEALHEWIYGPYNRIADIKMYLFFFRLTATAAVVFGVLILLSVFIKNFWCRYLCPYGALLGLVSALSPVCVQRTPSRCIGCRRCTNACPNRISVHRKNRVHSPECTACYSCIRSCGKQQALKMGPVGIQAAISLTAYAVITVGVFILTAQAAQSVGYWHSDTPPELYRTLIERIHTIEHP